MNALEPLITDAGLAAVFNAQNDGVKATIAEIALGSSGYEPESSQTALQSEEIRHSIAGGSAVSDHQIHLTAVADGSDEFWVREVGFILEDGTLLAVWSHPDTPLAFKSARVDLLLAFDLLLKALPADSVTVEVTGDLSLFYGEEFARVTKSYIRTLRVVKSLINAREDHAAAINQLSREILGTDLV